ncbi:hypothetical protein [Telmatospirillum sp.]|uniref:hypothetical protein n=1 Tax=Telmatospirillum sp. TaxID=2079197 RepID=UPI00283C9A27|nr:hypothetical protein [Telmatospirillum sp.]MDR3440329.1 hypothetical protein [Telmatospirillum sp.]
MLRDEGHAFVGGGTATAERADVEGIFEDAVVRRERGAAKDLLLVMAGINRC